MRVEIAFSGQGTRRPRTGAKLVRVQPGAPLSMIVTSPGPVVITYHWHNDKPFIHTRPVCLCSSLVVPTRERAYVGAMVARREPEKGWVFEPRVVELSASGLEEVDIAMRDYRTLRGAKLVLRREGVKINSRLLVELKGYEDAAKVGPEMDVLSFVQALWGEFLPPVALPQIYAADDRVVGDDPGFELPV